MNQNQPNLNRMLEFNMPKNKSARIKVIGVGGGGTNAVNHMFRLGIKDVDLVVANTDRQSLDMSPVLNKIQLGEKLTEGLGAGTNPERGREAALESIDAIREYLQGSTKMLFVTAGMGGGTGTGAAPVIARVARELGLLTVGIVTTPFDYEGLRTQKQADSGIEELKKYADATIVVSNETLRAEYGDMDIDNAYGKADDILATAAKSIAECITTVGTQNVDFEDVRVALTNSGVALIGNGAASGVGRALAATERALESRLLNDKEIQGAKFILINVTYGTKKITLDELTEIATYVRRAAGDNVQIKQGRVFDETLEDNISVTIIAAGFNRAEEVNAAAPAQVAEVVSPVSQAALELDINPAPFNIVESVPAAEFEAVSASVAAQVEESPVAEAEMPIVLDLFQAVQAPAVASEVPMEVEMEFELEQAPVAEVEMAFEQVVINEAEVPAAEVESNEIQFSVAPMSDPLHQASPRSQMNDILASTVAAVENKSSELADDRKNKLKQLNYNYENSAFSAKNPNEDFMAHSSAEKTYNEFSVIRNADNQSEIRRNSYLHDKLD